MTTDVLPKAAEAGHLTDVLRRAGVLEEGRVRAVTIESSRTTIVSRIIRLRLSYEGKAAGAPGSLLLKTGLPERSGPNEGLGCRDLLAG
jgi:hypothetical protein